MREARSLRGSEGIGARRELETEETAKEQVASRIAATHFAVAHAGALVWQTDFTI